MHSGGIAAHTACIKMEKEARDHGEMNRCREPQKTGTQETLREELSRVNKELRRAEELFDVVTEDTLIEACTYRIQTLLTYRTYLLRTARRQAEQPEPIAL